MQVITLVQVCTQILLSYVLLASSFTTVKCTQFYLKVKTHAIALTLFSSSLNRFTKGDSLGDFPVRKGTKILQTHLLCLGWHWCYSCAKTSQPLSLHNQGSLIPRSLPALVFSLPVGRQKEISWWETLCWSVLSTKQDVLMLPHKHCGLQTFDRHNISRTRPTSVCMLHCTVRSNHAAVFHYMTHYITVSVAITVYTNSQDIFPATAGAIRTHQLYI